MTSICTGCNEPFEQPRAESRRKRYCTNRCRTANGPWSFRAYRPEVSYRGQIPPEQRHVPFGR